MHIIGDNYCFSCKNYVVNELEHKYDFQPDEVIEIDPQLFIEFAVTDASFNKVPNAFPHKQKLLDKNRRLSQPECIHQVKHIYAFG